MIFTCELFLSLVTHSSTLIVHLSFFIQAAAKKQAGAPRRSSRSETKTVKTYNVDKLSSQQFTPDSDDEAPAVLFEDSSDGFQEGSSDDLSSSSEESDETSSSESEQSDETSSSDDSDEDDQDGGFKSNTALKLLSRAGAGAGASRKRTRRKVGAGAGAGAGVIMSSSVRRRGNKVGAMITRDPS